MRLEYRTRQMIRPTGRALQAARRPPFWPAARRPPPWNRGTRRRSPSRSGAGRTRGPCGSSVGSRAFPARSRGANACRIWSCRRLAWTKLRPIYQRIRLQILVDHPARGFLLICLMILSNFSFFDLRMCVECVFYVCISFSVNLCNRRFSTALFVGCVCCGLIHFHIVPQI